LKLKEERLSGKGVSIKKAQKSALHYITMYIVLNLNVFDYSTGLAPKRKAAPFKHW